jgi:Spy/CpxP family protein refolding chaperone
MKRIIASALVAALSLGAAKAQTAPAPGNTREHRHHRSKHWMEKLDLTADQKSQLKALREDFHKQFTDLKNQKQLSDADLKQKRRELHQAFRSKMEAVLTPAQKDQLAKMRSEWKEKHKGQTAFGRHRFQNRLKEKLSLSDAQVQQLKQMHQDTRSQFEAIRKNTALSADQKKAALKTLREKRQEQLKTVLTPDQLQKLQELRKERKHDDAK